MTKKDTSAAQQSSTPQKAKEARQSSTCEKHSKRADGVRRNQARRSRKKSAIGRAEINLYSMYESSSTYILDDLNSIALYQQRFYNLLKVKPKNAVTRQTKCRCEKSKCGARYCECFADGQICSEGCSCINCINTDPLKHVGSTVSTTPQETSCKCEKSECVKNYCECFQRGEVCGIRCQCKNCLNYL